MATRPISDRLGDTPDGDLVCLDPTCVVCWLWPRTGEEKAEWLARLAERPQPPHGVPWTCPRR